MRETLHRWINSLLSAPFSLKGEGSGMSVTSPAPQARTIATAPTSSPALLPRGRREQIVLYFCFACLFLVTSTAYPADYQSYLNRFATFNHWSEHLPTTPDNDFLTFIEEDKPLANKLRERWLYHLANQQDWPNFHHYYRFSEDKTLQCYFHHANYKLGNTTLALNAAKELWFQGQSITKACEPLLDWFTHSQSFDERWLGQRIALALDAHNVSLARYLLKRYKVPKLKEEQLLLAIHQNPARISTLSRGDLHDLLYLYGLKRMVSVNMNKAIVLWEQPLTKKMLPAALQQDFLAHLTLYKIMRDQQDADRWFAKIKPGFHTDVLVEWSIRRALKHEQWTEVKRLIALLKDGQNPCWQYWLARALEALGEQTQAASIYKNLAQTRQYYGFLASLRLHKNCSFQNEKASNNPKTLEAYQSIISTIKQHYHTKKIWLASRLLNDFLLELPKEDKSTLVSWVASDLKWLAKAIYLSDTELNNQLSLRFPLPFQRWVEANAAHYHVPAELIYAIIRQESGFREDALSSAGARGLMQVMPATARIVAQHEKISYKNHQQLFVSLKNITLGSAYLGYLSKHFTHNIILMAAAYNAGPRQVHNWLKTPSHQAMDIWIETLPWRETRNYLKNVLSFYAVYQYRLQRKSDLARVMGTERS